MTQKLAEILDGLTSEIGQTVKSCEQLATWRKIAGEKVSAQTEAVKIKNRTLFVNAASPAWAHELSFLKKEFIDKFNQAAGQEAIRDIRFGAGG